MTSRFVEEESVRPAGTGDEALLARLRQTIDDRLVPLLPAGTRCALLDFPNSGNVGDAAIWVGEKAWLEKLGIEVVYSCDRYTYSQTRLRKELRDGVILWHGGGNLGDLWPGFQTFREKVVSSFPDNAVVQLPQSIYFSRRENAERASAIFNRHPNLHLLLRDKPSLSRAQDLFEASASLCPDLALVIDPPADLPRPTRDVLWLSRTDLESSGSSIAEEALTLDWLTDTAPHLRRPVTKAAGYTVNRVLSAGLRRWPSRVPPPAFLSHSTYDWRARQRLERGYRILTMGKVVVTDRLHGHILCCLLHIPHVVLGDRFGKLRSFYDTWTKDFRKARFADSATEAQDAANELLSGLP